MKAIKYLASAALLFFAACSTLTLQPADFSWPVESVLKVDNNGLAQEKRFSFSFNTKELFLKETNDSLGYQNKELRVIRDNKGYYFMVANNFKNVYVFKTDDGTFRLKNQITISDTSGIENPAFNQRPPYIELTYDPDKKINLTNEGIQEEKK